MKPELKVVRPNTRKVTKEVTLDLTNPEHVKIFQAHCVFKGATSGIKTLLLAGLIGGVQIPEELVRTILEVIHTTTWADTYQVFPFLEKEKVSFSFKTNSFTYEVEEVID
jgi:hypothetical protein